jgi:uncharacterized SAM-binding protein YcdF (DUF218 family)
MKPGKLRALLLSTFLVVSAAVVCLMRWGGYLLISSDPLPSRAQVAVVLQGSMLAEQARLAGAVELLQQGKVPQILVSIPKQSYWGQSLEPIAMSYIEKTYGELAAARTRFCETGPEVDSTEQEAAVLARCINEEGWNSVVLVTSDYHSRRTKIIWRRVLKQQKSSVQQVWVHGVGSAEFNAAGWWRRRISAKTWITECTKLWWTLLAS